MRTYFILLFTAFGLVFSCKKEVQQATKQQTKPTKSKVFTHKKPTALKVFAATEVNNWKEYHNFAEFLNRFESTSPSEALSNALELKDLSKNLKDSIRIKELKTASFKARVNTLENEALRLADMTYIPSITADEVNAQIDKIFLIFTSVNAKINTVFAKKRFDNDVDLDDFFKLDSTEKGVRKVVKPTPSSSKKKIKLPTNFNPKRKKPVDKTLYN